MISWNRVSSAARRSVRGRVLSTAAAAALLAGGMTLLGPAGSAQAAASDCEGGRNGFIDISDNAYDTTARQVTLWSEGINISLQYGNIRGVQRGWALIAGDVQPGNQVWLDWTRDGGRTWIQCGPFTSRGGENKTSAAQRTSSDANWKFRACGSTRSGIHCTDPWW
ncbi:MULTISPECIES: hypothetical protein [unclassified Streptomyces]|uniref:hypothetical protein n=1 Tax=unclassified Streptomyces TaxID=2593676 RepID=UPI0007098C36|nr:MULTISPECIES: hypothetical protein [unclassified Streptomyces]KRD19943.1 hypothetical protein ASE41_16400 [Streptomyces sp. Root264]